MTPSFGRDFEGEEGILRGRKALEMHRRKCTVLVKKVLAPYFRDDLAGAHFPPPLPPLWIEPQMYRSIV